MNKENCALKLVDEIILSVKNENACCTGNFTQYNQISVSCHVVSRQLRNTRKSSIPSQSVWDSWWTVTGTSFSLIQGVLISP